MSNDTEIYCISYMLPIIFCYCNSTYWMGNILVFHMGAPLIGGNTPQSHAHFIPPTICRLNMSAHQDIYSSLLCVHDNLQPSKFSASDTITWKCPPT